MSGKIILFHVSCVGGGYTLIKLLLLSNRSFVRHNTFRLQHLNTATFSKRFLRNFTVCEGWCFNVIEKIEQVPWTMANQINMF